MIFFESESVGAHWGLIPIFGMVPKLEPEVMQAHATLTHRPYKKKFEPLFRIYDETH